MWQSMGLAGTTAITVVNVTHPIDLVKTRVQMDHKFKIDNLIKQEGATSLWKGIKELREAKFL